MYFLMLVLKKSFIVSVTDYFIATTIHNDVRIGGCPLQRRLSGDSRR